jgi:hypothetical protein
VPEYNAGEARLRIVPDATGFKRRLDADLKKIQAEYAVKVTADTARASKELEAWRTREGRNSVNLNVDVDTTGASTQIAALRRQLQSASDAGAGFAKLFSGGLTSPASLFGAAGLLPAAASGIGQVAAAIQQLAGVAPLLPASLAGITAVVGTVKLGLTGVSDAFDAVDKASDGTAKSIAAANQALAGLAPNAAAAVTTAVKLKNQLTQALTLPIQQNLFEGLSQSAQKLYDSDIPILQQRLPQLASTLNGLVRQVADSLGSDQSKGFLDRILGNTDEAAAKLSRAIDPIVTAIGHITAAGSNALPRISDAIANMADRFNNFVTNAANSGALDTWISNGITAFGRLADTAGNIVSAIHNIADAAGGDLLKNIDDVSQKFANWLNSKDGREDLKNFLDTGKQQLHDINEIAKNLGPSFGEGFKTAAEDVGQLLAALKKITQWYDELPGWLKGAITEGASLGIIHPTTTQPPPSPPGLPGTAPDIEHLGGVRPIPGRASGGPSPTSGMRGPTGGWISELHDNEWVLPAHARKAVGDEALWALTSGAAPLANVTGSGGNDRWGSGGFTHGPTHVGPGNTNAGTGLPNGVEGAPGWWKKIVDNATFPWWWNNTTGRDPRLHPGMPGFAGGGYIDQWGNPVTQGPPPGVAPNPWPGGGVNSIVGSIVSGIQGPIGNALSLGSSLAGAAGGQGGGGSLADRFAGTPGLFGLIGSAASSDPATNLMNWGTQTGQWLGGFAAKTAGSFGTALWQGALGLVGLDNSILSPSNPWFQDAQRGAAGVLGGLNPSSSDSTGSGGSGSVSDADLAALQQSGVSHLAADRGNSPRPLKETPVAPNAKPGGAPVGGNQGVVYQAMINAGFAPSEWSSLQSLLNDESGFRNTAKNPTSTAYGMFQFLDSTWGTVGGSKTADPGLQAQYGLTYIKQRYGTPSAAWAAWQSRSPHWYSLGGAARGPGGPTGDQIPALLSNDEHVFTAQDVAAMGGQSAVYAFRRGLHRSAGGPVKLAGVPWDPNYESPRMPGIPPPPGGGGGTHIGGPWWARRPGHEHIMVPPWWWQGGPRFGHIPGGFDQWGGPATGYADGGKVGLPVDPRQPLPRPPDARQIIARPVAPPSTPSRIGPPQLQPPAAAQSAPPEPPPTIAPSTTAYTPAGAPVAAAPTSYDHNLKAIDTAIDSTATVLGNIASQAIAAGMGGAGIPGGGAAGSFAAGLIQESGKVAKDVVNVGSSFLVGNVTPGTTANPYGQTLHPQQNEPITAGGRTQINTFYGHDTQSVFQELDVRNAQDQQAALAHRRVR